MVLRQWLVPAVPDEPTTYVVPFLCPLCKLFYELVSRIINTINKMKKALIETQTLHTGCSKVQPKNFAPPQTPFPRERDGQNLISWRWSYIYLQTQFGKDRCTQFRVIVVTDSQTNKHTPPATDRTDNNALRR